MTMSVQDYRQIAYFNLQFLPEKKNASITSNMEVLKCYDWMFHTPLWTGKIEEVLKVWEKKGGKEEEEEEEGNPPAIQPPSLSFLSHIQNSSYKSS